MPFEIIEGFLHVIVADPITDVTGIGILRYHPQRFLCPCAANHDAGVWG